MPGKARKAGVRRGSGLHAFIWAVRNAGGWTAPLFHCIYIDRRLAYIKDGKQNGFIGFWSAR